VRSRYSAPLRIFIQHYRFRPWEILELTPLQQEFYLELFARHAEELEELREQAARSRPRSIGSR
jgi:hypothetical protein